MVKITLENGTVLEGSVEELRQIGVKFPEQVKPLEVGDYAKVVGGVSFIERLSEGDIVKISSKAANFDFRVKRLSDGTSELFMAGDLVRATDEEVAEAKRQQAEKAVVDKWADIGRKPNEFKVGDIVRVAYGYGEVKIDDIGVVTEADGSQLPSVTVRGEQRYVRVELITPVEQRFDKPAGDSE